MKNHFRFSLLFVLALSIISCKEKATEATDANAVAATEGAKFVADAAATKISWEGSKPAGKHMGTINLTQGEVFMTGDSITGGSFTLDMNTITVTDLQGDEKASLEGHLKGTAKEGVEDFFNTTKYPTAKFEITSVAPATDVPGANVNVTGNLTLLETTKSITFPANVTVADSTVNVTAAPFTINRTDWGIKYGSKTFFDNLADKFIDDNISLSISLTANKEVAAAPAQ